MKFTHNGTEYDVASPKFTMSSRYSKCPRCGYWAFDGYECHDCGYRRFALTTLRGEEAKRG